MSTEKKQIEAAEAILKVREMHPEAYCSLSPIYGWRVFSCPVSHPYKVELLGSDGHSQGAAWIAAYIRERGPKEPGQGSSNAPPYWNCPNDRAHRLEFYPRWKNTMRCKTCLIPPQFSNPYATPSVPQDTPLVAELKEAKAEIDKWSSEKLADAKATFDAPGLAEMHERGPEKLTREEEAELRRINDTHNIFISDADIARYRELQAKKKGVPAAPAVPQEKQAELTETNHERARRENTEEVDCHCGQMKVPIPFDRVHWYWQIHGRKECTLELPNSRCWCGLLRSEHIKGHATSAPPAQREGEQGVEIHSVKEKAWQHFQGNEYFSTQIRERVQKFTNGEFTALAQFILSLRDAEIATLRQQLAQKDTQLEEARRERDEAKQAKRFHDDTTPLPCGCPTFYLYMHAHDKQVFCGQCGKRYGPSSALTAVGEDGLPEITFWDKSGDGVLRDFENAYRQRTDQLRAAFSVLAEKEKEVEMLNGMCWKFFNAITTKPLTPEEKSALDEFRAALTAPTTEENPKP